MGLSYREPGDPQMFFDFSFHEFHGKNAQMPDNYNLIQATIPQLPFKQPVICLVWNSFAGLVE